MAWEHSIPSLDWSRLEMLKICVEAIEDQRDVSSLAGIIGNRRDTVCVDMKKTSPGRQVEG